MADSIREQIIAHIKNRMALVTVANGYNTDIGLHVFRSLRRPLEPHEIPAVIVGEGKEKPIDDQSYGFDRYYLEVMLDARIDFSDNEDWMVIGNKALADIKKAVGLDVGFSNLALDTNLKVAQVGEAEEKQRVIGVDTVFIVDYRTVHLDPYN